MSWNVHKEEANHFVVHGDTGPFRVAKAQLSPTAVERFRMLCNGGKVKKAKGGKVEPPKMADGGKAPETDSFGTRKDWASTSWTDGGGNQWALDTKTGQPFKVAKGSPGQPAGPEWAYDKKTGERFQVSRDDETGEPFRVWQHGDAPKATALPGEWAYGEPPAQPQLAATAKLTSPGNPSSSSAPAVSIRPDSSITFDPNNPATVDTARALGFNPSDAALAAARAPAAPSPTPQPQPVAQAEPTAEDDTGAKLSRGGRAPIHAAGGVQVPDDPPPAPLAQPTGPLGGAPERDATPAIRYQEGVDRSINTNSSEALGKLFHAIGDTVTSHSSGSMSQVEKAAAQKAGVDVPQPAPGAPAAPVQPTVAGAPGPTPPAGTPASPPPGMPPPGAPPMPPAPGSSILGPGSVMAAANKTAQAQEQLGQTQQQNAQQLAAKVDTNAQEQRAWLQLQQQRDAEGRTALRQMFDDLRSEKIDPSHFWADKSTFDKVRMGVSMFFGGMGSALTGGPNVAAQFIEKAMDRDMEAQKANLNKKATVYSYYLDQMKDERAAALMTHSVLSNVLASELDAAATRAGGATQAQQGRLLAAQTHEAAIGQANQATVLQTQNQFQQYQLRQMQNQWELMRQMMGGAGGAQSNYVPSSSRPVFTGDFDKWMERSQGQQIDWKDAQGRRWSSHAKPSQAKEAQQSLDELGQVRDDVTELKQIASQASLPGSVVPWSSVRAKWDSLQGHMKELSPAASAAVHRLNESELKIGESESGESIFRNKLNGGAALDQTLEVLQRRQDAILRGQGIDERFLGAPRQPGAGDTHPMVRH